MEESSGVGVVALELVFLPLVVVFFEPVSAGSAEVNIRGRLEGTSVKMLVALSLDVVVGSATRTRDWTEAKRAEAALADDREARRADLEEK
jgi:hypothetical protein